MDSITTVESIFFAALEKATPQEREAFLAAACGPNPELRQRVERLLHAQPKVGQFLEAAGLPPTTAPALRPSVRGP